MRLGPTVGLMDKGGHRQFLRLWCNQDFPSEFATKVFWLLMYDVKEESRIEGHFGVWNVREEFIYFGPTIRDTDLRTELEEQAREFERLLNQ